MIGYKILAGFSAFAIATLMNVTGIDSGPKVGASLPAFDPIHASGPDAGTRTCPVCKYGNLPAVQVWVNGGPTPDIVKLAGVLDKRTTELNKGQAKFKSFMVFKAHEVKEMETQLAKLAKVYELENVAMTCVPKDSKALDLYEINPDAKTTVLVYKNRELMEKFVDLNLQKQFAELNDAIDRVAK